MTSSPVAATVPPIINAVLSFSQSHSVHCDTVEGNGTVHMVGITTTWLTGGSKDRLTNKILKRSVHCDCDVVDSITLQTLHSITSGGDNSTSSTWFLIPFNSRVVNVIIAECLPLHHIAGYNNR